MDEKTPSTRLSKSVLITAVVLAVIAVVIVNVYIRTMGGRQKPLRVVEAKRRLEVDRPVAREDVRIVEIPMPAENVAENMVKEDQLADILQTRRPLLQAVNMNERLLWSHFISDSSTPGRELVRPGYRGKSVQVNPKTSPVRSLRPGMYVDLLATMPPNQAAGLEAVTATLLERVMLVEAGGRTLHDPPAARPDYSTVMLEVTPQQAEKIATIEEYLREGFKIHLRNSEEPAPAGGGDRLDEAMKRFGLTGGGGATRRPPASRP